VFSSSALYLRNMNFQLSSCNSWLRGSSCGGTLGTAATTGLLYQPRMIRDGDCGEIGGMKIGRGNKYSEKPCRSATFVHHKIPHDQTRVWTQATAVRSRRLTAWAMARPLPTVFLFWFVRLLAVRPLLAYCASLGWQWRWLWRSRWNVDW
jgi:hypothetical protein